MDSAGERSELLAAVVRSSLDCIVVIDDAGLVVEFNPAAERVFGHAREAAIEPGFLTMGDIPPPFGRPMTNQPTLRQ